MFTRVVPYLHRWEDRESRSSLMAAKPIIGVIPIVSDGYRTGAVCEVGGSMF